MDIEDILWTIREANLALQALDFSIREKKRKCKNIYKVTQRPKFQEEIEELVEEIEEYAERMRAALYKPYWDPKTKKSKVQ